MTEPAHQKTLSERSKPGMAKWAAGLRFLEGDPRRMIRLAWNEDHVGLAGFRAAWRRSIHGAINARGNMPVRRTRECEGALIRDKLRFRALRGSDTSGLQFGRVLETREARKRFPEFTKRPETDF